MSNDHDAVVQLLQDLTAKLRASVHSLKPSQRLHFLWCLKDEVNEHIRERIKEAFTRKHDG